MNPALTPRPPAGSLRCDKCGQLNVGDLHIVARLGEHHYQRHQGERGRNSDQFYRASTCGAWISNGEPRRAL